MLRYIVEDTGTPGLVLGIREADGATRIVSYGSSGRRALELGPRSPFQIGSITKTFTAAVLADMAARGEVALDDPVARYLPEQVRVPSRDGREVTLLDLATHTSGLPTWPMNLSLHGNNPLANSGVRPARTSSTVRARNSAGYGRLVFGIVNTSF
jgi:serine-type D-Ala-D-Ala carboxypeptidase/endopeptidase